MLDLWKFRVWQLLLTTLMIAGCSQVQETGQPGILVTTDWLQDHLNDPDLVILHTGSADFYDSIHIQGARLIDPYDFTISIDGVRNQMPPPDSIVELLRSVGVNNDSRIVLYHEDIRLLNRTARVFVSLDHLGLGEQTFVLNGGLSAWIEEGLETSDMLPDLSPGKFEVTEINELFISAIELDSQRWSNKVVVIDARPDEEYYGTPETEEMGAAGGHIEGAYYLSYLQITYDDSPYLFRTDSELKDLFRQAGMDPEKVTLLYCNTGIRGSLNYLAARHLGYPALFYDGSFEEWESLEMPITRPLTRPVELSE